MVGEIACAVYAAKSTGSPSSIPARCFGSMQAHTRLGIPNEPELSGAASGSV
jgi:hypothetical protein